MAAPSWIDVRAKYAGDLAAAVAGEPAGSVLYLPFGVYNLPASTAANGVILNKPSMTIRGDGPEQTFIKPYSSGDSNSTALTIAEDWITIADLTIGNDTPPLPALPVPPAPPAALTGTGDGIRIGSATKVVSYTRLERVEIRYMGRHGINACPGKNGATTFNTDLYAESGFGGGGFTWYDPINIATFLDVYCSGNKGCGMRLWAPANLTIIGGMMLGNRRTGLRAVSWRSGTLQSVEAAMNGADTTELTWDGQIVLNNTQGVAVMGNQCEEFLARYNKNGLVLDNGVGLLVSGNSFVNKVADAGSIAMLVADATMGCTISGNKFTSQGKTIFFRDATTTGNFVGPQFVNGESATAKSEMTILGGQGNMAMVPLGTYANGKLNMVGGLLLPPVPYAPGATWSTAFQKGTLICDSNGVGATMLKYFDGTNWYMLTGTLLPAT